ncbi:dihydrolipoyltranssuccinase [Beijerinckiaceae bacterium RH AL1]|nr:dihydrolipoyltranssuccinase [Beijerinckiaceae bacterium RH AL8]VVB42420.1 dihydrolipoyltranssuccinase [Beijerinckiaceae bacterium RH CH11]VVC53300.1 dihydrolipoyltranssuccinase [Beijerinckiaceae bacterium RH AL1]
MTTEIRVPTLGESVSEATIGRWFKKAGDAVKADEPLCELETDKVTLEVNAPAAGVLAEIVAKDGETVAPGGLLGQISEGGAGAAPAPAAAEAKATAPAESAKAAPAASRAAAAATPGNGSAEPKGPKPMPPAPAAAKLAADRGIDLDGVEGSGRRGQVVKGDVLTLKPAQARAPEPAPTIRAPSPATDAEREERVRMTKLRQTIARRLKDAQNSAAMLTTFNEVDMSAVMALRAKYKDTFEKKFGAKLGFMGFFVKACVQALRDVPAVNAEIDGQDLIYKNYYHLGIAVGTDKGLVVPVVRDCDQLNIAQIEQQIAGFGRRARDGQLKIEEMQGGTFTITNGGIYGSLMSTPILNAPQSGILGMHKIQERPVAVAGKVEIRPMMYLALSYDHRIVDGKEAVTFLVRVKEALEDPTRLVLDL